MQNMTQTTKWSCFIQNRAWKKHRDLIFENDKDYGRPLCKDYGKKYFKVGDVWKTTLDKNCFMQGENDFKNVLILEKWEDLKSGQIGHFVTATVIQKS